MSSSVISLKLPEQLVSFATAEAERNGTSLDQWFEEDLERRRVLQQQTDEFFRVRRERAKPGSAQAWLDSLPNVPPMPGDEFE